MLSSPDYIGGYFKKTGLLSFRSGEQELGETEAGLPRDSTKCWDDGQGGRCSAWRSVSAPHNLGMLVGIGERGKRDE